MTKRRGSPRVAIVGGGVGGVATAYYLTKAGVGVDLFEAAQDTGGLARSFALAGRREERYYHFICRPDEDLLGLADDVGLSHTIHWRRSETTFFHQGRLHPFTSPADMLRFTPLPRRARVNFGLRALQWSLRRDFRALDEVEAKQWLIEHLGQRTYDVCWSPLLAMKFGRYHDQVSAAWVWHRVYRVAKSRQSPLHPQVMGYFEGGTETLVRALERAIENGGGRVRTGIPIEAVSKDAGGRLRGVVWAGKERRYDAVVMAVPLPAAADMLPTGLDEYRNRLTRIPFIGVVCVVAQLDFSPANSFWCNVHDDRLQFNGIIEMSALDPARGGAHTLVYVPHYLPTDHARFSWPDEAFVDEFADALPLFRAGAGRRSIRQVRVFRDSCAQPICRTGFLGIQPSHVTPVDGLYLLDSTQLYPSDRTVSGMIGQARIVHRLVLEHLDGRPREAR